MGRFFKKKNASDSRSLRRAMRDDVLAHKQQDELVDEMQQRYNFRRNRTLTGSSSSHVTSVSEANAQFKSPRVQTHELIKKRRHLGALFILVVMGGLSIYILIQQFTASVVVRAPHVVAALDKQYEETIQSYFSSRPIERLRFLMNQEALNEYVKKELPEVSSVKVTGYAGLGKSSVLLTMRQPLAAWAIQGKQLYVDASGTAFGKNYYPAPAIQIVDNSGVRSGDGQLASNRFLGFIGQTVGLAKSQGYEVAQVAIPPLTTRQAEIRLTGINYPIKMSVDRKVGEQIEDMVRLIRWFEQRKQTPQYIDLRVSGKAFYK